MPLITSYLLLPHQHHNLERQPSTSKEPPCQQSLEPERVSTVVLAPNRLLHHQHHHHHHHHDRHHHHNGCYSGADAKAKDPTRASAESQFSFSRR
ncbi:hypothetical protein Syun_025633 [Stephania yunnanensis]|uniref:Uncharacterized protein n=1 Tax=Stephania yunnanensis TaxID=152371 RepID=A0AAP0EZ62_9MAGN